MIGMGARRWPISNPHRYLHPLFRPSDGVNSTNSVFDSDVLHVGWKLRRETGRFFADEHHHDARPEAYQASGAAAEAWFLWYQC